MLIAFAIIYLIVMCIKEGSPGEKGCAWTVVGIVVFFYLLSSAGIGSDGILTVFGILFVIGIIVGAAVLVSKSKTAANSRPPQAPPAPVAPKSLPPKKPYVKPAPPAIRPEAHMANVNIPQISEPAQLESEKIQIDRELDDVEKRLDAFIKTYTAAERKDG